MSSPSLQTLLASVLSIVALLGCPVRQAFAGTAGNDLTTAGDPTGVVIQSIEKGSALEAAGLLPDDLVLAWTHSTQPVDRAEASAGRIDSFFDWVWLEAEQAQKGGIQLSVRRNGSLLKIDVPPGEWDIRVRPAMTASILATYEAGKILVDQRLVDPKKAEEGAAVWMSLLEHQLATSEWTLRCWLHIRTGIAWEWARQWDRAHAEYRLAAAEALTPVARAVALETAAKSYGAQQSFEEAHAAFLQAIDIWQSAFGEGLGVARLNFFLGALASYNERIDLEELYLGRTVALQEKLAPESFDLGLTLHFLANTALERGNLVKAEQQIQKASAIWNKTSPDSLYTAAIQDVLAMIAQKREDYSERRRFLQRSLELREKLAPESLDFAEVLQNLGTLELEAGDVDKASSYLERALVIREKLRRPEDLFFASLLSALAHLAKERGDPLLEAVYLKRALAIRQRIGPESRSVASSFLTLSQSARDRGDLVLAWEYGLESLRLFQKNVPGSPYEAHILNTLGGIAEARNDLELARVYSRKAFEIVSKLTPEGADAASILTNLANIELQQGDLGAAQNCLESALALWQKNDPKILRAASTLVGLGDVALRRGLLSVAQQRYETALRVQELAAPDTLEALTIYRDLGQLAITRGNFSEALRRLAQALSIAQRLAPSSLVEAELFHLIGNVHRRLNHPDTAVLSYRNAVQALEDQGARLGGTQDIQANFGAQHEKIYRDFLDLLIEQGKPEEAIVVLERSKARSFLSQLARRDLTWPLDLPPEKERERRRLRVEYDEAQAQISELDSKKDQPRIDDLRSHLHEMRQKYSEVTSALLDASPRVANFLRPASINLLQMRQSLDPGTLALLFDVDDERVHLFAFSADSPLRFINLDLREADLRHDIQLLLRLAAEAPVSPTVDVLREHSRAKVSARLYDALLGPINDLIMGSSRLLIVPDGPLNLLPWGALAAPAEPGHDRSFLITRKPFHVSLSLSIYAQLRALRGRLDQRASPLTLAAFGDPLFPLSPEILPESKLELRVRSVARNGFHFDPLPASRREVERIVGLYPDANRSFLGSAATEENAKALPKNTRIVHFATHATVDNQSPLDSAVVLSIPAEFEEGKDNGLLQAWEIIEQVRIDADLVVLSACDSGLGKEMGGEGLFGLTRAFQFAGARSVIASLWKVSDLTTAELMVRFYKNLRGGLSKDEALRQAQIELSRGPIELAGENGETTLFDATAPYFWAGFQVYGDWK